MVVKSVSKRRRRILAVLIVLIAAVAYLAVRIVLLVTAKPTISVNYAAQYNECLKAADLDPNDNAAPGYRAAFALLPDTTDDIWAVGALWRYEPNSIVRKTVDSWVASCDEAMQALRQASKQRAFRAELSTVNFFDPVSMEGLSLRSFRTAAICLRCKAQSLAIQGDLAGAFDCIVTVCRMARHLNTGGRMHINIGQALNGLAMSTALDVLSRMQVDSSLLSKAQIQFEETLLGSKPPSFAGDEVLLQDAIQRCFTDNGKGNGHMIPGIFYDEFRRIETPQNELVANGVYLRFLYIAWAHPSRVQTLRTLKGLVQRANELVTQSPWELRAKGTSHEQELTRLARGNYFLQFMTTDATLARTIELHHRIRVSGEALVTTMGLLRFHKDKGVWPASLEELAGARYIRAVPLDPWSGKPLVYKPAGDSFILYGCGLDFDDDGGLASKWGSSPEGGDQVFWPVEEYKK
ncbi:MAG TPA: hypothetical protein PKH24_04155 [Sedimentisphaerales bacterium]|jgi:hypothetical protein|nr:hypothetical protein [Sedimentisphaerales bacterium]HNU29957.1 hypothetical protein [Sedimentisphaerales bacterium]